MDMGFDYKRFWKSKNRALRAYGEQDLRLMFCLADVVVVNDPGNHKAPPGCE